MVEVNCPKCGWSDWEFEDGWFTCDHCGHEWYSGLEYEDVYGDEDDIPAGCSACDNSDYPNCKWSCKLIDE